MIRIKSAVLQASKVVDFQFHFFVIPSPGQSPFTPTSSIWLLVEDLLNGGWREIYLKKIKNLNTFSVSAPITSPLVLLLPQPFMFYISPIHIYVLNCIKDSKTKNNIGRKNYINTYERGRNTYTFFEFRDKHEMS